jgi:hypothetical protein
LDNKNRKIDIAGKDYRPTNLSHVAYEVWDGGQRPAPDVHVRVHRQILIPHLDLGELYVHTAGIDVEHQETKQSSEP